MGFMIVMMMMTTRGRRRRRGWRVFEQKVVQEKGGRIREIREAVRPSSKFLVICF